MATKKQRIPETLFRVYEHRARTLSDAIISLLPPPPSSPVECRCKGRRCLGCSGIQFLLKIDDPYEYKDLLNKCFVVLSEDSPPLTSFYPGCHWSQRQIVTRTIELMIPQKSGNTICNGYDKMKNSSCVLDLLSTLAWKLLLTRIGDELMVHLLRFGSIFLPHGRKDHRQVAGFPISNFCPNISKPASAAYHRPASIGELGTPSKRKRTTTEDEYESDLICAKRSGSYRSLDSVDCNQSNHRVISPFLSKLSLVKRCTTVTKNQELNELPQQSLKKAVGKSVKRFRPSSWQRRRIRRKMKFTEDSAVGFCSDIQISENDNHKEFQQIAEELPGLDSEKQHAPCVHSKTCFCNMMLQAPQKVAKTSEVDRNSMFYIPCTLSSLLPRDHVLMRSKPSNAGEDVLMKDIFGLPDEAVIAESTSCSCLHNHSSCLLGCASLHQSLRQLLGNLMRSGQRCQYLKLLDKHCPIMAVAPPAKGNLGSILEGRTRNVSGHQLELSGSDCRKSQVASFIWAVCRRIIPEDLLGAPSEWRALQRNISKFIRLRRSEKFSVRQCVHGLKTSRFPFLSNKHFSKDMVGGSVNISAGCNTAENAKITLKNKLFVCWIYWFFSSLVTPILKSTFYVTESEAGKQDIFYYRKQNWEKLTQTAVACMRERSYRLLDYKYLRSILFKRPFGFSKVRFCPKGKGVRALANMKTASSIPADKKVIPLQRSSNFHFNSMQNNEGRKYFFKAVNNGLRDLSAVLKGIQMNHPHLLGSSVSCYDNVYEKLAPYLIGLKNRVKFMPRAYVVICDVSKAFDSIDQDKLLQVMKDVMMNGQYLTKWSSQVICTKKYMHVLNNQIFLNQNMEPFSAKSTASVPSHSVHNVFINQETSIELKKEKLQRDLYELVKRNVIQVGQDFYLQKIGIPQGSIVSSFLCSFYYAHMETKVLLPFLKNIHETHYSETTEGELQERHTCQDVDLRSLDLTENGTDDISSTPNFTLLRYTDDFLFISTSKKQAVSFYSRLVRGFRDYNCSINEAKSCMNFDIGSASGVPTNRIYTGEDGISFLPWSGLLLNCRTLEIQADYTRYLGMHLRSTLTLSWQGKPGFQMKDKLRQFLRPKCHAIFYDSQINSAAVVRLNVYQAFLLSAMKFHCYLRDLSSTCSFPAGYYFEMIKSSVRYMHKLILKRMRSENIGSTVRPVLKLEKEEVLWLGLKAYVRALKKKQSSYKDLLSLLRSELVAHGSTRVSTALKYAIDDSHSSSFWKIKY
ncbi:hypothetical protein MKW98_018413 [Papaver atlanticum]|uniref:Telomerase reverse transcriptase n=1 Tax=Papaver atlanticum TaxID=357466 RepID=A0AAD4XPR5_9MAGN|nr:hypothetical protein MKW98_018413 [Papaver atlanticum]